MTLKINFSENAQEILRRRYLHEGETIEDRFRTVARVVARGDKEQKEKFFQMMWNQEFLPNTPTLMNAGRENAQLSACFVLPIEDSMDSIFSTLKNMATIHKSGGGTGFDFSTLRPKGSKISTSGGEASGPVSFMKVFDAATSAINQGGMRRGANMGILRIDHPDIMEFIKCKDEEGVLTNFNISVAIPKGFFDKLWNHEENRGVFRTDWPLYFEGKQYGSVDAFELWDSLIHQMWKNGEPGIVFIDEINEAFKKQGIAHYGQVTATNPCITGDTRIAIPSEGHEYVRTVTIKDLAVQYNYNGEPFEVFGLKPYSETPIVTSAIAFESGNKRVLRVEMHDGTYFECTEDHLLAVCGTCGDVYYIEAHMLKIPALRRKFPMVAFREQYQRLEKHYSFIRSVKDTGRTETVYDLNVPETHNFFIVPADGHEPEDRVTKRPVLVHNCGEQPLLPYESCNLGSINLSEMTYEIEEWLLPEVDYDKLKLTVRNAVDFLNNVLDINHFPLEEIKEATLRTRKIGLGVMGWADLLIKLRIPYGSSDSLKLARDIMGFINTTAHEYSAQRGYNNATVTTIAPTGTISMIADCSSGIEPLFALSYTKTVMDGTRLPYIHPSLEELGLTDEEKKKVIDTGSLAWCKRLEESLRDVWLTAGELRPYAHIEIQRMFQQNVDNAISKTINMPNDATYEDIADAITLAYRPRWEGETRLHSVKGLTIYRDGSRQVQVLTKPSTDAKEEPDGILLRVSQGRPKVTHGEVTEFSTGCGSLYVVAAQDAEGMYEVFCETGKHGGCKAQSEALGRLVSYVLRSAKTKEELQERLKGMAKSLGGIRCASCLKAGSEVISCPDALSRVLDIKDVNPDLNNINVPINIDDKSLNDALDASFRRLWHDVNEPTVLCPDCQSALIPAEGCVMCPNCGYSRCS